MLNDLGPGFSSRPVRYHNGEIRIVTSDLVSNAFGADWGHTRSYSNLLRADYDGPNGMNWFIKEAPILLNDNGTIVIVGIVNNPLFFNKVGSNYVSRFFIKDTLVHDTAGMKFIHTDIRGKRTEFYDFTVIEELRGRFIRSIDSHGGTAHVKEAQYDTTTHRLTSISQSVSGVGSVGYVYAYYTSGDNFGKLQSAALQVNGTNVRRAVFEYYGEDEDHGNLSDLKLVTIQTWKTPCPSGTAVWADVHKTYYRYYKAGEEHGFERGLRWVVGPEAFARLEANGHNPLTATNAVIAAYADHNFEFDSQKRVTKEITNGGAMTFSYAYTKSNFAKGYNNWEVKTVETLPDNNQNIVYTNAWGQVILKVFKAGTDEWFDYYQFDSKGRMTLQAASSAVASYTESSAGLVTLNASSGLINVLEYYADNASGTGEAPGRLRYQKLKKGGNGTAVLILELQYVKRQTPDGAETFPVGKEILYPKEDGTGAITTEYSYTWFTNTQQVDELTITLPTVPTSQNGTNTTDTRKEKYSPYGQLLWAREERGYITGFAYDLLNGGISQRIDDAGSSSSPPWTPVSGTRLNLLTDYSYDSLGRLTQELGPSHQIDLNGTATTVRRARWAVYQDDTFETWEARGYASGTGFSNSTLAQPVNIWRFDRAFRITAEIQATRATGTSSKLDRCDTFAQSSLTRWTQFHFDDSGRMDWKRVYHTIPSSGSGSSGTNYNQTEFGYNSMMLRNKEKTPGGTINKTDYTPNGWVAAFWIGTDDSGGANDNMVKIEERAYDGGADGGDGNLTQITRYESGVSGATRVTTYEYDWRNRQTSANAPIDSYQEFTYDNVNRRITTELHKSSDDALGWKVENKFDNRGRIYQTRRQGTNGSSGNTLVDNSWRDVAGNVIRRKPAGRDAFELIVYDSLNRITKRYLAFGPGNVTGDTVVQQDEMTFDDAGNAILQVTRERFHNATGTGELTSPGGSQPKARVSYVANYPDALGRAINVANYGTNHGSALTRPSTAPARSDDVLVTTTAYNDRGEAHQITDPKGTVRRAAFDDADRVTQTIENYVSGGTNADQNKTTNFTYNADGNLATLTAVNAATGNQITTYVYGTTLGNSDVASSLLLRAVIYPDSSDSPNPLSGTDHVEFQCNRMGERKQMKDQRGVIHDYDYDKLGRLIHDRVTLPGGSTVDNAVLRISRTYEFRGMLEKVTSYNNATVGSGSVVNEAKFTFNEFGQLIKDEQAHSSAVGSGTPAVQYAYAIGADNHIRPTRLTYPDGRELNFNYGD